MPEKRPTKLANLDGDEILDAVVSGVTMFPAGFKSIAYRGLGSGQFEAVQELVGACGVAMGDLGGGVGIDVLSTPWWGQGPPIGVWLNLVFGLSAVGNEPLRNSRVLSVYPTVAGSDVEITCSEGVEWRDVVILDVQGRRVRSFRGSAGAITWDLRNGAGVRVAPGAYWVRAVGTLGAATRRVTVLR